MEISSLRLTYTGLIAASILLSACSKTSVPAEAPIPDSPDAAVQKIISEFAEGNSGVVWRALPTSYQNDVNGLMNLAGSKVDKEVHEKSFSLMNRFAEIVEQQKSFIANSSFMKNQSPEELAKLEAALPSVANLVITIATSELSTTEGLANFDGETFFDKTVAKCIEHLETIGQLTGDEMKLADYAATTVTIVESDGQQAKLSIAIPEQEAEEITFTKFEERWIPVELEKDWAKTINQMKASLNNFSAEEFEAQKTQIMGAITMLDGVLNHIASAQTQEQFDKSLEDSTMPLMGIFMMISQATGMAN